MPLRVPGRAVATGKSLSVFSMLDKNESQIYECTLTSYSVQMVRQQDSEGAISWDSFTGAEDGVPKRSGLENLRNKVQES